jgi:hypothetical protein
VPVCYKDRFKCFSCEVWGDELDLVKLLHPGQDENQRNRSRPEGGRCTARSAAQEAPGFGFPIEWRADGDPIRPHAEGPGVSPPG